MRVRNAAVKEIKRKYLLPDPLNWHTHPEHQRRALAAVFREVGFVGHVLVRPAPGQRNRWILIDGHERIGHFGPDEMVPCCVLDVDEAEARKLLRSYDPLGYLAGIDRAALDQLCGEAAFDDAELETLVTRGLDAIAAAGGETTDPPISEAIEFGSPPDEVSATFGQMQEIYAKRKKGNANVAAQRDTERYLVIVFGDRTSKEDWLKAQGLPADERYLPIASLEIRVIDAQPLPHKSAPASKSGATG